MLVAPQAEDPAAVVVCREDVRLAFIAALQHLPPRRRAVLLLREVLAFPATEVAELLATTTAAANSALQRARTRLDGLRLEPAELTLPDDATEARLLERYVTAFEGQDYDTLVTLLCEDAEMAMPPLVWWVQGRDDVVRAWRSDPAACAGTRLLPTRANAGPAFARYVWSEELGRLEPRSLMVLELDGARVRRLTLYLDTPTWFPLFGFPPTWPHDAPSTDADGHR